jgi:long-subunit acyl-CoA synthetase (AMP-forming)
MALFCGAAIGFFRGNVLLIKDDLAALQPTIFPSVPRLFNKFHGRIQDAFDQAQVLRSVTHPQQINHTFRKHAHHSLVAYLFPMFIVSRASKHG